MTTLSPKGKADRLLRIFERTGREGQWTRAVQDFPGTVRTQILGGVNMASGELPILACFKGDGQWTLITTDQVVICRDGSSQSLPWTEIADATMDAGHTSAILGSSPRGKLSLTRLIVVRVGGEQVEVELEPGPCFIGVWNVLKAVGGLQAD